jgi:uncharacterized membrane protein YtjA (UPF0391 family)
MDRFRRKTSELYVFSPVGDRRGKKRNKIGGLAMLRMAISFLVLALIAGVLGFGGIAAVSVDIARVLFMVFLILFAVAFVFHVLRGKAPPV